MTDTTPPPPTRTRLLDMRSGGYALVIGGVLSLMIVAWQLAIVLGSGCAAAVGDGTNPETYGFRLDNLRVDRNVLVAGGSPKDALATLTMPGNVSADDVETINTELRGHYLVSSDRVIGVTINGEARCWPVRVLQWHEVVNDTVGGVPVVVSFSAYSDCAVVAERVATTDAASASQIERTFGYSGLLWNHTPLLYDRQPGKAGQPGSGAESLWSPLQARAVAGPAADANARLQLRHAQLVTWSWWHQRYPATRVMAPESLVQWCEAWHADPEAAGKPYADKRYKRDPYSTWYASPKLSYPVDPLPPDAGADGARPLKTGALAVRVMHADSAGPWLDVDYAQVAEAAADSDEPGVWKLMHDDVPLRLTLLKSVVGRPSVAVEVDTTRLPATADVPPLQVIHAFRFAMFATRERSE